MSWRERLEKSLGLGDVVEAVTEATGVKAAVESVARRTGRDCGCRKRKDALNRLVPFRNRRSDDEGTDTSSGDAR